MSQSTPQDAPYPPPAQAYPAVREHPQGTLVLVLGLLSVLGLTILGPFAWYYGNKVVREIDREPYAYSNRGFAIAGKVMGIIGTAFLVLIALGLTLAVVGILLAAVASA